MLARNLRGPLAKGGILLPDTADFLSRICKLLIFEPCFFLESFNFCKSLFYLALNVLLSARRLLNITPDTLN